MWDFRFFYLTISAENAAAGLARGTLTYVFLIKGQQPHFAHNLGAYAQVDTWMIFRVKITANKITT